MNDSGSKGLVVGIVGLIVLVGGIMAYRSWNKEDAGPRKVGPDKVIGARLPAESNPGDPSVVGKKVGLNQVVEVPFIFWGGDVATFHANGGMDTKPNSLLDKHGLKVKLTPGDDFEKQIKDYKENKSPFLRGTLSMLGQFSEDLTAKPETTPVVFLQLTWSAGDHLVGRAGFKKLDDLKGKKIALQEGGPHVGMLNDILQTARLEWKDIQVVWTKEVSGDKGPAELFRKDASIDACFAISPEMAELASAPAEGGIDSVGDGSKKSIKGAHVVVSTAHMSRSIADVYACRQDFYNANREWVDKFVAGFLKGCEEVVDVKKRAINKEKAAEDRYKGIIKLAQDIWSKDPAFKDQVAKEDDVDGLISDAVFVGLPGNETFFKTKGNLSGLHFKQQQALRLPGDPSKEQLKTNPRLFVAANLDYAALRKLGDLNGKAPSQARITAEPKIEPEAMIFTFNIYFEPNQSAFSAAQYGDDFERALEVASLFGNTALAIRGHADGSNWVHLILDTGTKNNILKKQAGDSYVTAADGKSVNPKDVKQLLAVIEQSPKLKTNELSQWPDGLKKLSADRAEEVRKTVVKYARDNGLVLDEKQFRAQGVGILEPKDIDYVKRAVDENRRVEFSIIKVPLKDLNTNEFDL